MIATLGRLGDYLALAKPRITLMALAVAAAALWLAPGTISTSRALLSLLGIAMVVAAANALNMFIERDIDALMARTCRRPLPTGRLRPLAALAFGLALAAASLVLLAVAAGPLPTALSAFALVNYACLYTPMKRRTPWALPVGAVSGAIPVLAGWTAATGRLDAVGVVLFLLLFTWQIPHFLAISLFRKEEYGRAGILVVPNVQGDFAARVQAAVTTLLLVLLTALLVPLGAGATYAVLAAALGASFLILVGRGLFPRAGDAWARRVFHASLAYYPAILGALALDVVLR